MAIINVTKRNYVKHSIYKTLDAKTFLVRVPTISIMSDDELTIKGVSTTSFDYGMLKLDDSKDRYSKLKKKKVKRDTSNDTTVIGVDGNILGDMSDSMLNSITSNRSTRKTKTKSEKMLEDKTETYLTISAMLDIYQNGFSIVLLNSEDVPIVNRVINDTLDKIEHSINIKNHSLAEGLKDFLEHMVGLNKVRLNVHTAVKDTKYMNDVFGTDIFNTSPAPTKTYNMKNIKV